MVLACYFFFGANTFATIRPMRLRMSTMTMSTSAADHARSIGMAVTQPLPASAGQFAWYFEYSC